MTQLIDAGTARRIALAAQGFHTTRASGRVDVRHYRKLLRTLGLLQLDSVNVLVRSHYLPVFSRLGAYDRTALDRFTSHSRELFEYWGHEASLLPIDVYPLLRWRMKAFATKPWRRAQALMKDHPGYLDRVVQQIAERGPSTVSDLAERGERTGSWWGYGPSKTALEWLFAIGRLSAYRGKQFIRVYDLAERLIPAEVYSVTSPDRDDCYRELLLRAARFHGLGTAADLADYYRLHIPTARPLLAELAAEGHLVEATVPGWRHPAYLHPDAAIPRRDRGTTLLSPFDPVVWHRDRAHRLFGFHYRIEIYVPQAKRVHGYYVLPFMLDGDLVGRVDLKAHRKTGTLEVRGAFHEADVDPKTVAGPLRDELARLAGWLELDTVTHGDRGNLMPTLAKA